MVRFEGLGFYRVMIYGGIFIEFVDYLEGVFGLFLFWVYFFDFVKGSFYIYFVSDRYYFGIRKRKFSLWFIYVYFWGVWEWNKSLFYCFLWKMM